MSDIVEVTNMPAYNRLRGRSFLCDADTATKYVEENCKKAHHVDEVFTRNRKLENKVWWEGEHGLSDKGTRKIAHYSERQHLLIVYDLDEGES